MFDSANEHMSIKVTTLTSVQCPVSGVCCTTVDQRNDICTCGWLASWLADKARVPSMQRITSTHSCTAVQVVQERRAVTVTVTRCHRSQQKFVCLTFLAKTQAWFMSPPKEKCRGCCVSAPHTAKSHSHPHHPLDTWDFASSSCCCCCCCGQQFPL